MTNKLSDVYYWEDKLDEEGMGVDEEGNPKFNSDDALTYAKSIHRMSPDNLTREELENEMTLDPEKELKL